MVKKAVLCLSGWAQKSNSLEILFAKDQFEVINFDYSKFSSVQDFFDEIAKLKTPIDILCGWSLGGQLSCRLIAKKILKPQYFILIAAPFQFVKDNKIAAAMPQKSFDEFRSNFIANPDSTLKKFGILMNIHDKNAAYLGGNLDINQENQQNLAFWLDELERFSCFDLDFSNFPQTLVFHGSADLVVHPSQSQIFKDRIANSRLEIINNCGHTPHINFTQNLQGKIVGFCH